MTTLADLTPEERAQCRGMWVTYQTPMGEHQAIYEDDNVLFEPGYGLFTVPFHHITPLYDLPRAWAPDGTPPQGEWEYTECLSMTGGYTCRRRWVGEWDTE